MGKEVSENGQNPTPASDAGLIPIEQAARLLMVTAERVRQLIKLEYVPRGPKGKVLLVGAVQGYIRFLKDEDRRSSKSAADSRVRDARAQQIEMQIAEKRRELIPAEDATGALDVVVGACREEFTGLPARVTRDLELRRKIEAEVNGSFGRIAEVLAASAKFVAEGGELPNTGAADDA